MHFGKTNLLTYSLFCLHRIVKKDVLATIIDTDEVLQEIPLTAIVAITAVGAVVVTVMITVVLLLRTEGVVAVIVRVQGPEIDTTMPAMEIDTAGGPIVQDRGRLLRGVIDEDHTQILSVVVTLMECKVIPRPSCIPMAWQCSNPLVERFPTWDCHHRLPLQGMLRLITQGCMFRSRLFLSSSGNNKCSWVPILNRQPFPPCKDMARQATSLRHFQRPMPCMEQAMR